ncbi:hypothetical protein [Sodalis ligni]|uniref:hypothetical protein n=1 Tax=Sodalis ligni TaxID=2697027 RepID=UPI003B84A0B3
MNKHFCYAVVFILLTGAAPLSYAAGCLKGAAVGAAVGHLKNHAVLGAWGVVSSAIIWRPRIKKIRPKDNGATLPALTPVNMSGHGMFFYLA